MSNNVDFAVLLCNDFGLCLKSEKLDIFFFRVLSFSFFTTPSLNAQKHRPEVTILGSLLRVEVDSNPPVSHGGLNDFLTRFSPRYKRSRAAAHASHAAARPLVGSLESIKVQNR